MDARQAIQINLDMAETVGLSYVSDLTDEELLLRPHPECNHINWQLGHLIVSEHQLMSKIAAHRMPCLPDGFETRYAKENAKSDNPAKFATKQTLLDTYRQQRSGTRTVLESFSDEELDRESGVPYAPTVGALISMQGSHWLMHCGQWVIVRRRCHRPIVI